MAIVLRADPSNKVDLAGVGAVPRPVDIDASATGFQSLKTLRIYRFAPQGVIDGHAEDDEVIVVVLGGEIELQIRSDGWASSAARFALAAPGHPSGAPCAAYLPAQADYSLTPKTPADIAYARATPTHALPPVLFTPILRARTESGPDATDVRSPADRLRVQLRIIATGDRESVLPLVDDLPVEREALVHVHTASADAITVGTSSESAVALASWDTLALPAGERPDLRIAPHSNGLLLLVSAA